MSDESTSTTGAGLDRRDFLMAGAGGMAAAGFGMNVANAGSPAPGKTPKTNSKSGKRVALINDAKMQIGPPIALELAMKGHNLVLAQPADGLVKECRSHGADVVVVPGIEQEGSMDESQPNSTQKLVDAAMDRFGGFDSAYIRTAIHVKGDILESTPEVFRESFDSNYMAVVYALQSLMPPLMDAGSGQILVLTSATADKPYYDMAAYCSMRVAANMLIRCAAMTGAPRGVVVNAIGSNFMNYPDAVRTLGGADKMDTIAKKIPLGRFGETSEVAHTAVTLLDGHNMFATGMFLAMAGGYNTKSDAAAMMAM